MLYTASDSTRIDFTIPSDSALRRIIVDPDVKSVGVWLGNKRIEQLASYIKGAKAEQAFVTPTNLTAALQCSSSVETSSIWSDFTFAQVGDATNKAALGDASRHHKVEKLDPLPISHYMTETESQMIEQWAGRVVETANPNGLIPEAPLEGEEQKKVGRTRRVKKVEDEEEEEEDEEDPPLPILTTASKTMNDALNSQFNARRARVGRMRVKRIEEEDEDEDNPGLDRSLSNVEKPDTWIYPPLAELDAGASRFMPSRKKPGRRRMVKKESDDEVEDNDTATSLQEEHRLRKRDNAFAEVPPPSNLDTSEILDDWADPVYPQESADTSNDWDVTVYPSISSFGEYNPSQFESAASQKNPVPDWPLADKQALKTEELPDSAPETSRSSRANESRGRGRGHGRATRGRVVGPARDASAKQAASSRGGGEGSRKQIPRGASQQYRDHSGGRTTGGSKNLTPSDRRRGRSGQLGRGGNSYGVLATDALVDISETEGEDTGTTTLSPEVEYSQQAQRRGAASSHPDASNSNFSARAELIDFSTPEMERSTRIAHPPGFEPQSDAVLHDQDSNQRYRPSIGAQASASGIVGSQIMPHTGASYVNTSNPGMNLTEMSRRRVEQLHRARGEESSPNTSTDKLQDIDESSTRTYRTTMNQQAKKPAQNKKEAEQRRALVLQDAWGTGTSSTQAKPNGPTPSPSARKAELTEISATKRKLLRGKESMAGSHPEAASEEQTILHTDKFTIAMTPVFKAARAFPGALKFEVQLGQFLSPSPDGAYQSKCVTVNQWHKLYDGPHGRLASAATFTNILTRNGADVDHIVKLKNTKTGGGKLFHYDDPGRFSVRFEFHCQGKNNDEFKLVFDQRGEYEIERPFRKIGQVNLHIPGQVWDAAGVLMGSTRFPEESALKEAAEELRKSLYIPEGRKEIEISYRLPSTNEFAVKRVIMRRISRHTCAIMDKHDVQLQITEVQRLFVERRSDGIYLAYASGYEKMVDQMMIHFEVSLVSDSIERAMSVNAKLAVGDVTTAWTEDSLLQKWRVKTLLEIVHLVVSKIDGVGFHNVGSAVFFLGQNSVLAGGSAVAIGSQVPNQPVSKLATQNVQAVINVPGVRGGLAQPINQSYALGYGGARIPIPGLGDTDGLIPEDSASQAPEQGGPNGQVMAGFW